MGELKQIKDFYRSFCPTLGHLENATPTLPSPLVPCVFGVFGVFVFWSSSKQVQENVVHLIILYLLLWLVTYKVKVFSWPCPKPHRLCKKKVKINSGTAIFSIFFLWQYNYAWENHHLFLEWLWVVKDP